jgi:hypothetical protein
MGAGFGTIAFGGFDGTTGAIVLPGCGTNGLRMAVGANQFNEDISLDTGGDEMVSSGNLDVVAQPAKRIAAPKMIPTVLNTRPFC